MSDYLRTLPLTKSLLADYDPSRFPGGGKIRYDSVLIATHEYLNANVHPTVQQRAALHDAGVYLTDHGPKHVELVLQRASTLARTNESARSEHTPHRFFRTLLDPYEVLLLTLGVHFHDVGNMYGRAGHQQRIGDIMEQIGSLSALPWSQRNLIARIASSHAGTIEGDKDTIRLLEVELHDGDIRYRPQLLAGLLRLADELSDEYSRADQYGLLAPDELPPTCLPYQKYAQALTVWINLAEGQVHFRFQLHADDLREPLKKRLANGSEVDVYLLDEIYERTLKTYNEMVYCGKYTRALDTQLFELRVEISVFETVRHTQPSHRFSYTIGDVGYPSQPGTSREILARLARGFDQVKTGSEIANLLHTTSLTE